MRDAGHSLLHRMPGSVREYFVYPQGRFFTSRNPVDQPQEIARGVQMRHVRLFGLQILAGVVFFGFCACQQGGDSEHEQVFGGPKGRDAKGNLL